MATRLPPSLPEPIPTPRPNTPPLCQFGLPRVSKMIEGRDMREAVVGQMHPRMRSTEFSDRVQELADKYTKPGKADTVDQARWES